MALFKALSGSSGGGGGYTYPDYVGVKNGNGIVNYNVAFSMSMPSTTKHFILAFCRQGGGVDYLVGDVDGQTLQQYLVTSTVSEGEITLTDVTWGTYISLINNGTINFTAEVSRVTGGNGSHVYLLCWDS